MMILAEYATPHFTFRTVNRIAGDAVVTIERAWAKHAAETGADPDYFDADDVTIHNLEEGVVARDGVGQDPGFYVDPDFAR